MPTIKTRINVTVPDEVKVIFTQLAERDGMSVSAKVLDMALAYLEIEEDAVLNRVADERLATVKDSDWVSHEEAWL